MESGAWDTVKTVVGWLTYPAIYLVSYLHTQGRGELNVLKASVAELKTQQAVTTSQISDIRDDLKELVITIRDAEKTLSDDLRALQTIILGK